MEKDAERDRWRPARVRGLPQQTARNTLKDSAWRQTVPEPEEQHRIERIG